MEDLFSTLPKIIQVSDDDSLKEAMIFAAYKKVTRDYRERTFPIRLSDRRLLVAVPDRTCKRNLEKVSEEIVFRLNSLVKQPLVTFIDFKVDKSYFRKTQVVEKSADPLDAVSPDIRSFACAIKDDNLRYRFLLTVGACLEREKRLKSCEQID